MSALQKRSFERVVFVLVAIPESREKGWAFQPYSLRMAFKFGTLMLLRPRRKEGLTILLQVLRRLLPSFPPSNLSESTMPLENGYGIGAYVSLSIRISLPVLAIFYKSSSFVASEAAIVGCTRSRSRGNVSSKHLDTSKMAANSFWLPLKPTWKGNLQQNHHPSPTLPPLPNPPPPCKPSPTPNHPPPPRQFA